MFEPSKLGGGVKHFLFSHLLGEKIPMLTNIFQMGWNHQLVDVWTIKSMEVNQFVQWLFLVPLKGGGDYITPQKAIYKWYISGIYCQLGGYIIPTTF